uniref:Uncharacterized protein n=1 Tax=Oryza nivara TaxID=4536 RepID=A0A0E0IAB4_ORYNI
MARRRVSAGAASTPIHQIGIQGRTTKALHGCSVVIKSSTSVVGPYAWTPAAEEEQTAAAAQTAPAAPLPDLRREPAGSGGKGGAPLALGQRRRTEVESRRPEGDAGAGGVTCGVPECWHCANNTSTATYPSTVYACVGRSPPRWSSCTSVPLCFGGGGRRPTSSLSSSDGCP